MKKFVTIYENGIKKNVDVNVYVKVWHWLFMECQ